MGNKRNLQKELEKIIERTAASDEIPLILQKTLVIMIINAENIFLHIS